MFKLFGKKSEPSAQAAPNFLAAIFDKNEKEIAKLKPLIDKINELGQEFKNLDDDQIKTRARALKDRFREEVTARLEKRGMEWQELDTYLSWSNEYVAARNEIEAQVLDELQPEAFALTREAGDRTIGLRHFDVQLIGGAVLHSGRIAEMKTGEGKTLVATLPVFLNAISGRGAHIITVNDYLAERDANWMRPIYEFLGLTVAFLQNEMDNEARQIAYNSDVLYATNSEVGFDYLRDNMARRPNDIVQRPLNFAIVDEVDNILIDEARTPLIISAQVAKTERALRRQQLSKICDGVARKLMPAVTDREVEILIDSLTHKGRISIDGLMAEIEKRGAFTQATQYLIESYLLTEKSARTHNAARLLDVADEYSGNQLISDAGRAVLENLASQSTQPEHLRKAWREEIARLVEPFVHAWAHAVDIGFDAPNLPDTLVSDLALPDEVVSTLPEAFAGEDNKSAAAEVLADEAVRRGLLDDRTPLVHLLLELDADDYPHDALTETILETRGPLNEAEAILLGGVPEGDAALSPAEIRTVIGALENISGRGLLAFQTMEKLWEAVQLPQKRDSLRDSIARAIAENPGASAQKISVLTQEYSAAREAFLQRESEVLKSKLGGHDAIAARAKNGESAAQLKSALQNEVVKSGGFSSAMKEVRNFATEQKRAHASLAENLVEEMAQWVEVPKDARKQIAALLDEGGTIDATRERVLLATRDLPGENTELPALVAAALQQLMQWRAEKSGELMEKISAHVALSSEGASELQNAISEGAHGGDFETFAGEQLLTAPEIAPLAAAIDEFGAKWDEFKNAQSTQMVENIGALLELSLDAREGLAELLSKPLGKKLDAAIFEELASDATSRHLEPLLTPENAVAFTEEIKRRIPMAKEMQKIKPAEFAGRSAEQLQRTLHRMVERSLQVLPFDDYKSIVKNLAWMTEKDERRRTAALSDMGTLLAEREAGNIAFAEPENFLETLLTSEILTDEEVALIRQAQIETPDATVAALADRVLRLPAERRRRLSEAKQQEVQPVLDQAIKAHALFHREINYVIGIEEDTGKRGIVIVDEFTGRKMPGRRYSEGLHEALEAKHNLDVQLESQTVATITIQNYFRLYRKLGGMTGTAKTEEQEFAKTYGVEVISIPTNRVVSRKDFPDTVYKTEEAKFRAIAFEILEHHCAAQPVLAGTRSVEVSERLSERLKPTALQTAVLSHLCKTKLWETKEISDAERTQILEVLRAPVLQVPLTSVKAIAKQIGVNPDPLAEENLDKILSLFTVKNPSRERLASALKNGLPHNVLNAKNHRSEARIVAEAARPGAVTIATNMAGRGVDILLGGSLDIETRWRVTALQVLARHLDGKPVHVRSRNADTTNNLETRLTASRLQDLAWLVAVRQHVDELEKNGALQGQAIKEMRDALGQEITTADLRNKVKSRARRLSLLEKLPLDDDPSKDLAPAQAIADELQKLMNQKYEASRILEVLQNGIATQSSGRDAGEVVLLETLAHPLGMAQRATANLLETLSTLPDMDRQLLELAAASGATREADFELENLASQISGATPEWARETLKRLHIHDAPSAKNKLESLKGDEIEINELQLALALGAEYLGPQWLRERLKDWGFAKQERAYDAPQELRETIADAAIVHYRLNQNAAQQLRDEWKNDGAKRRAMTILEAPNLVLLSDMANLVQSKSGAADANFLDPEWLHQTLAHYDIIGDGDVFEAQMQGQAQDENGNVRDVPLDVLVYRLQLPRVLNALQPTLQEAVAKVGNDAKAVHEYLLRHANWAKDFIDENWTSEQLRSLSTQPSSDLQSPASVSIETGVAGQSADIVLESEPRPEDIAHTSERELVTQLGGLHIIGSERHESRRIDNQLRGRAGRQGDPGSSRFFISLEDELWRLFGTRGQFLLKQWDEDEPVEAKIISKSVERAQKKVELNHFESRKHVLQYDDVMNLQREKIYGERRRALMGANLHDFVLDMAQHAAISEADKHCPQDLRHEEWDAHKLYASLTRLFGGALLARHLHLEDLLALKTRDEIDEKIREAVAACYAEREAQVGEDQMRSVEQWQVMRSIDEYWMEHLAEMDYLRDAIWQEGYAQKEPIGVFRQEGYALFHKMLENIRRQVTEQLFSLQIAPQVQQQYSGPQIEEMQEMRLVAPLMMDSDGLDDGVQLDKDADGDDDEEPQIIMQQRERASTSTTATLTAPSTPHAMQRNGAPSNNAVSFENVGRNDPCPCGSGKKFKMCHGAKTR